MAEGSGEFTDAEKSPDDQQLNGEPPKEWGA